MRRTRVGKRVLEAGEARVVTICQTYDASLEDVWDACTDTERLGRWRFLPVLSDLRLGGRYRLEGGINASVGTTPRRERRGRRERGERAPHGRPHHRRLHGAAASRPMSPTTEISARRGDRLQRPCHFRVGRVRRVIQYGKRRIADERSSATR
ncbi:SRPBCC domain-containing protein [Actinomadura alba]|uniref:SRPBCC domain-containing protein n=1 Tax=Actinomadura alba TaxID=406431 RepID=A0ABR7M3V3_9ACTN|nr:SRPBCC domain-containing protein [Actinomadura alba]